jgi:putative nucleotidyltransferase with HDIG domain
MQKTISVRDLRLGMYIEKMCGNWMNHPFWRSSFRLSDPKDLQTLQTCGLAEVVIDTSRGLDVEPPPAHALDTPVAEPATDGSAPVAPPQVKVSMEKELERAREIQAKAKREVSALFQQARMGKALEVGTVGPLVEEINASVERNAAALLSLVRLKTADDYTYMHSVAVCALMIALGRRLGLDGPTLQQAGMAGLLHDIGKMSVPSEVLNKPGKLTDEEFVVVKRHPAHGWETLRAAGMADEIALDVCLHHHERMDGKGYPERLSGEKISLFARMGAVCDVYDAISSERCYKKPWTPGESIQKMASWREGHFDEKIFQAFLKTVGIYPTGTLVKLKSGRLGVVLEQAEEGLLKPSVKVFFSTKSNGPIRLEVVDLRRSQDAIESMEDPTAWGFDLRKLTGV